MSRAEKSARKVVGFIEEKSLIDSREKGTIQGKDAKFTKGDITLENVSFKYPSRSKKILRNFNLKINGNESVALVGHSGSGKSTIASLLLRFYNKQSGSILIDGKDIESYSPKDIRDQIAIVMQEPLLFNEPIKENIRYGSPNATNADVLKAAEQANCLNFIQSDRDQLSVPEVKTAIENDLKSCLNTLKPKYSNFG